MDVEMEQQQENSCNVPMVSHEVFERAMAFDMGFLKKYIALHSSEFFFVEDEDEYLKEVVKFLLLKAAVKDVDALILSPSGCIDKGWHSFLLFPKKYAAFCDLILPTDIPSPRLIDHNPFGMFPSRLSNTTTSEQPSLDMESREVSSRSERYRKTYQMYLETFKTTPCACFWPLPGSRKRPTSPTANLPPCAPPPQESHKPTADDGEELEELTVMGSGGAQMVFRLKRSTPLRKVITSYCKLKGIKEEDYRFLTSDCVRFDPDLTLNEVDMGDTMLVSPCESGC